MSTEESDEELRERLRPSGDQPDLLAIVLGAAEGLIDAPTSLRGETVGIAHVRIYVSGGSACVLERRLRDRFPFTWLIEVVSE